MKKFALLLISAATLYTAKAQDPHFSQFFASPMTLNPALTGKFDGQLRVAGNYRNQWPAFNNVYTTSTLSVDFSIMKKNLPELDTWGVGIMALTDKAAAGVLVNNFLSVSTSYHKALDENGYHQIGAGFQASYGEKRLDVNKLIFEDQLTPFGFTGVTNDIFQKENQNIKYLDVNAGIIYTGSTSDDNNFYVGVSMYHINKPKESFKGGNWNISPRATVSAGGYLPVGRMLTFHGSGIYQIQNKATETTVGGALAATLTPAEEINPTAVYLGSWFRFGDAVIPYLGLEFSGIRLGASYDINISDLRPGSESRGGMEVSLIYIRRSPDHKGIPCPKF
jgi:type IX secretion system PorP/SprF family membrane protein